MGKLRRWRGRGMQRTLVNSHSGNAAVILKQCHKQLRAPCCEISIEHPAGVPRGVPQVSQCSCSYFGCAFCGGPLISRGAPIISLMSCECPDSEARRGPAKSTATNRRSSLLICHNCSTPFDRFCQLQSPPSVMYLPRQHGAETTGKQAFYIARLALNPRRTNSRASKSFHTSGGHFFELSC